MSRRPIWSSAGQAARNLPKLPCSLATSLTNFAFSRTDLIFCGLRTMRLSDASFSQNSAGWNSSRLGLNSRNASSKPGHLLSITLHTKPAQNTRAAISAMGLLLQPAVEEVEHRGLEQAVRDHREVVAAGDRHRLGAANGIRQALRRSRQLVAGAGNHQRWPANGRQRVARDRRARSARA